MVLFCLSLALSGTGSLEAQMVNATLTGFVHDSSGAAVAAATIVVTNQGTNLTRRTTTDGTGAYTVPALPPGEYRLEVEQPGFKKQVMPGIVLQVAQEARVDVALELGQVSESVTVSAAAPLINSENPMIGGVVTQERIADLPLNGRNFMQLSLLTGGINEGSGGSLPNSILAKGFAPSAGGAAGGDNNYSLDGADNTEAFFKTYNVAPSVDAVQEFRIQIGQYSAEFGGGGGAVINVLTKSGTNQFHGAAWEFVRNDALDARNYFLTPSQSIAALHQNQFGVAAGGPIIRNRTFIFGDFDLTRNSQGNFKSGNVPLETQQAGDLSGLGKTLIDPLSANRTPFPGGIIPSSRISPISAALVKYYPQPNAINPRQNYSANLGSISNSDNYLIKVDHKLSDRENLMGRYASQSNDRATPGTFPSVGGQKQPQRFQNALLSLTSTISPTLLNEAHFSYARTVNRTQGQNTGNPLAYNAGVPFAAASGLNAGFPESLSMGNTSITGLSEGQPWFLTVNSFHWYDSITWIHGAHSIKAGADIRRHRMDVDVATHANNSYTFSGQFTGDGFADFLLGFPSSSILELAPNSAGRFRATNQAYYVLDNWKVSQNLTFNLGVRYEYDAPQKELGGQTPLFDGRGSGGLLFPKQNTTALAWYQANRPDLSVGLLDRETEYQPDKNNIAPRVGFAWRPLHNETTVVRGGYGIFYSTGEVADYMWNSMTGPPGELWPTYTSSPTTPTLNYGGQIGIPPEQALRTATFGLIDGPEGNILNPYVQQWSLSIGRQIGKSFFLEAQYMGSKTTHLYNRFEYNATTPGTTPITTRVPYPKWGRLLGYSSGGAANYNGLLLTAEERLYRGLQFKASYTWSKYLAKNGSVMSHGDSTFVQDPFNLKNESGIASDNVGRRFTANLSYELPFGKGKPFANVSRGWDRLIGGWVVSSITTIQDGLYSNPSVANANCNNGIATNCRPDLLTDPLLGGSGVSTPRWSVAAFDWPNNPAHAKQAPRLGTSAGNVLLGNGLVNLDLSLRKEIPINEQARFEFRLESFNSLNHTNFGTPTASVESPNFGLTFSAGPARVNQFGLKLYW
jgi:hypothetical protein